MTPFFQLSLVIILLEMFPWRIQSANLIHDLVIWKNSGLKMKVLLASKRYEIAYRNSPIRNNSLLSDLWLKQVGPILFIFETRSTLT